MQLFKKILTRHICSPEELKLSWFTKEKEENEQENEMKAHLY